MCADRLYHASTTTAGQGSYERWYGNGETGNILFVNDKEYAYEGSGHPHAQPHAVTSTSDGDSFGYDQNGNMTSRTEGGVTYSQGWDPENWLASVSNETAGETITFTYDGDGALVKKEQGGQTTVYIGQAYEQNLASGEERTYYFFGDQRVAVQQGGVASYVHTDHLGSTSVMSDQAGNAVGEAIRYFPYGATRTGDSGTLPTDYLYTGQRQEPTTGGLYHMGARFYDPYIARWLSADTLVPDLSNPQSLNRYSWVLGNPLRFRDPTGHFTEDQIMQYFGVGTWDDVLETFKEGGELAGQWGWLGVLRAAGFGDKVDFLADRQNSVLLYHRYAERVFHECDGGISPIADELVRQATAFDLWEYVPGRWSAGNGPGGRVPAPYQRSATYIADKKYPVSRINWDKADRTGAIVDVAGLVGEVAFSFPPYGTGIWFGTEMLEIWDWGRKVHRLDAGDPWDVILEVQVSALQSFKLLPQWGGVANLISLGQNLGQGWETRP